MKPYVLLVEDDASIAEVVGAALQEEGYVVVRASTTARAITALGLRTPEVLLADLILEGGLTSESLIELALAMPAPPGVVLYSATPVEGQAVAERFGVTFVAKPFELDALLDAVDAAVARRTTVRPRR